MSDLSIIASREGAEGIGLVERTWERRPRSRARRWPWVLGAALVLVWSLRDAGVGRRAVVNPGGWPLVAKFFRAIVRPDLSATFLADTAHNALITVAYAVLGSVLSVVIGCVGAVLIAESSWTTSLAADHAGGRRRPQGMRRAGWLLARSILSVPRGIHEAVWGLFLVNVLGRDPLVAVLAIAIPFGAITAKVFAEMFDEASMQAYRMLRAGGARRSAAFVYGLLPDTLPDLVSYSFYRFECSLRSAVILGMIGAGGIGFQLRQSFDGLAYGQMWTLISVLVALGWVAEKWSAGLRRTSSTRRVRWSVAILGVGVVGSWWSVGLRPWRLWSAKASAGLHDIVERSWPPRLPRGSWSAMFTAGRETVQMAVIAIAVAVVLGVPAAIVAARPPQTVGLSSGRRRQRNVVGVLSGSVVRLLALVTRSVPPTVWALLVLFVVFPGILPGGIALGIYTFGVLARLFGEVIENLDDRPAQSLRRIGSRRFTTFLYATLPAVAPRWSTFALYRWEVAARESIVVGIVGAGGLGRMLARQTTAFDYNSMLTTVGALVALTVVVDGVSAAVRRSLR